MDDLTKLQKKVLVSMYKRYLDSDEKEFATADDCSRDCGLSLDHKKISDVCLSLYSKGYIDGDPGDDTIENIVLTDTTIVYMENRFKNGIKSIAEFLMQLL